MSKLNIYKLYLLYSNNTVDISLFECIEKENFHFDKVDSSASGTDIDHKFDKEAFDYAIKKTMKKK